MAESDPLLSSSSYQQQDVGFEVSPGQVHIPNDSDGDSNGQRRFSLRKLWAFTGPGFLMSIAYLDPGNIESDLQAGAVAQYKLLWVLWWSTVMGLVLQLLSARLGCATGLHLAEVCRNEYSTVPRIVLWIMMEIAIIGSDIQEVIGSAIAINLLSNNKIPIWAGALITAVDAFTFLFLENAGLRKLEAFFGALITTMAVSFMYMYIKVGPDQLDVLKGLAIPWCKGCDQQAIQQMVAIVGAVIMPHNLYLHSALVLSRSLDRTKKSVVKEANMYYAVESAIALLISFIINLFVVAVFAEAFSGDKYTDPSLINAGHWIAEKYGTVMKVIWGIGVLAAGQSSTMTGTYAGQFVMDGFLRIRWPRWRRVVLTRSVAMGPTLLVAVLATDRLDLLNNWLNILQSIQLPFALLPVLHFTSSQRVMGQFKNGKVVQSVVWCLAVLVMGINLYLVYVSLSTGQATWVYVIVTMVTLIYVCFVAYLAVGIGGAFKIKIWLFTKIGRSTDAAEASMAEYEEKQYQQLSEYQEIQ